jgi:Flp pilus assembly protein TadG
LGEVDGRYRGFGERMPVVRYRAASSALADRRGAIAFIFALLLPSVVAIMALVVDVGFFYLEQQRLQIAADAAAVGAALLLPNSPTTAQLQAAALQAADDATGGTLLGTLTTPVTVNATSSSLTVTLATQSDGFFAPALQMVAPKLQAKATAGTKQSASCVLALSTASAVAIQVDNMGSITASNCGIFSNSPASNSIYLNSGTISGSSVGAAGQVLLSNSGANTLSPSPAVSGGSVKADPFASMTAPTPGGCSFANGTSFTAWQSTPYHFTQSQNVFCGDTTIGGNGTTDIFDPGIYYVVNGNLTFSNATVSNVQGITFVLTGSAPGAFSWTNYSNTTTQMSAPTSGATAGILVWQACGCGSTPTNQFAGGSTMQISGAIYTPCATLELSNDAQLTTQSGGTMTVVADVIYVTGSAGIAAAGSTTSAGNAVVLQQ